MDAPGGISGVTGPNVIATAPSNQTPIAAAWDANDFTEGDGRLAVVMDVNWLDPSRKGPQADQFVQNLALFLSGDNQPSTEPVEIVTRSTDLGAEQGQAPHHVPATGTHS